MFLGSIEPMSHPQSHNIKNFACTFIEDIALFCSKIV